MQTNGLKVTKVIGGNGLNELALFAGAGGGILGGHLLGWRTVCAVEWESYPASVLLARQNDGILPPFPIWDDVQTFDGHPWRGVVDVISGGFPCQDISAAGKGAGIDGERSGMWGQMARIIHEVRPKFVFVENSPMLTSRGLGRVLGDLANMGFDAEWGVLGHDRFGGQHRRDRIWITAYTCKKSFRSLVKRQGKVLEQWKKKERSEGWVDFVVGDDGTTPPSWRVRGKKMIPDPSCGEVVMGWPMGWTELRPLAMDKFQEWWQQHGVC